MTRLDRMNMHAAALATQQQHRPAAADCTLAWQISKSPCVANQSYFCHMVDQFGLKDLTVHGDLFALDTQAGCRGWFHCGESLVQCGDWFKVQSSTKCQCGATRTVSNVTSFISPLLMGEYSRHLYGEARALDPAEVDVVLLDALSPRGLRALAEVGACRMDGSSSRPFFWNGLPRDAVWVQRSLAPRSFADGSWVEVVHCAVTSTSEIADAAYRGHHSAFWTYAAVGSGVSMNLGRTLVAKSYAHGVRLPEGFHHLPSPSTGLPSPSIAFH